jgi:hypothetical protein
VSIKGGRYFFLFREDCVRPADVLITNTANQPLIQKPSHPLRVSKGDAVRLLFFLDYYPSHDVRVRRLAEQLELSSRFGRDLIWLTPICRIYDDLAVDRWKSEEAGAVRPRLCPHLSII